MIIGLIQRLVLAVFKRVEALFSTAFDDDWNPLYHLGALSFFFFWIVGATGLYLFLLFETSISGAYLSIEYMTHEQWYFGGVMRSLHRYCSDAMAVTVTLHLLREFGLGRFTGVRWFSWVSGVPLLWFLFAAAIGGYWLVWDQLAQYVAITTTEWIDWLPNFGDPIARNFLSNETVSNRFFSLLVFLHISLPLVLLLGMFIHISRVANAKTNPPKGLAVGTALAFIVLSLVYPALSLAPADMSHTDSKLAFDWFFLTAYPFIERWSPGGVWLLLAGSSLLLIVLPWLVRTKQGNAAVVDPDHCNGCGWCVEDCPYSAIEFIPHTSSKYQRMVQVDASKCTACGICTGSCPTVAPQKQSGEIKSGIGIPDLDVEALHQRINTALSNLSGEDRVIVFGCDHGAQVEQINVNNVAQISLPCIGLLPPSFVDEMLKKKMIDGAVITGCCSQDCYFRSGNEWMEQRLTGKRMPRLRAKFSKASGNIRTLWAGALKQSKVEKTVRSFQSSLSKPGQSAVTIPSSNDFKKYARFFGQALFFSFFIFFIGFFASNPAYTQIPDDYGMIKISMRLSGQLIGECKTLSEEELSRLPANMRNSLVCPRERSSVELMLAIDGEKAFHQTIEPAGFRKDGRSNLYHRFKIPAGNHELIVKLKDDVRLETFNYTSTKSFVIEEGGLLIIDFDEASKSFTFAH